MQRLLCCFVQQLRWLEQFNLLGTMEGGWNRDEARLLSLIKVTTLKTLIVGLGNPIRTDDGVGLKVAEAVRGRFNHPEVDVTGTSAAGLELLDLISGYQRLIIIDAIETPGGKPAQVYRLGLEDLPAPMHCSTIHNVDLVTSLELGRRLKMIVPQQVVIFAVEVSDVTTFGERCTPQVEKAIPEVADMVIREIGSVT